MWNDVYHHEMQTDDTSIQWDGVYHLFEKPPKVGVCLTWLNLIPDIIRDSTNMDFPFEMSFTAFFGFCKLSK